MYVNALRVFCRLIPVQFRTMGTSRACILKLYKVMLREAQKFPSYNFRMYALRRTRDGFQGNKNLTEIDDINNAIKLAEVSLEVIKRQVMIGNLYAAEKLVIEKDPKASQHGIQM